MEFIDEYLAHPISANIHPHNGYYAGFPVGQEEVR